MHKHVWDYLPSKLYKTLCLPDQCICWLVDKLAFMEQIDHVRDHSRFGNADKWSESVVRGKRRTSSGRRKRGGGGGFQVGHAERLELQVQWPFRTFGLSENENGILRGLTQNTQTWLLLYRLWQERPSIHHIRYGSWFMLHFCLSFFVRHLRGPQGNICTHEVSQLSTGPCMENQTCSKSWPEASARKRKKEEKKTVCAPLSPFPLRHLCDCIDLSWFHSVGVPAGFQVSNICHTEAPSSWLIQNTRMR